MKKTRTNNVQQSLPPHEFIQIRRDKGQPAAINRLYFMFRPGPICLDILGMRTSYGVYKDILMYYNPMKIVGKFVLA